jgi:hypothetical protein
MAAKAEIQLGYLTRGEGRQRVEINASKRGYKTRKSFVFHCDLKFRSVIYLRGGRSYDANCPTLANPAPRINFTHLAVQ